MKKPELYQKTVDILVAAYFNDTLVHGNCYACAVGNLVAGNMGLRFEKSGGKMKWVGYKGYSLESKPEDAATWHVMEIRCKVPDLTHFDEHIKSQIAATGYSIEELGKIESAFESVCDIWEGDQEQEMFNGLMSVIEVLDEIHENTDTAVTNTSKKRFDKVLSA